MAVTATDLQPATSGWAVNAISANASGAEVLKAAPGAGVSLYLESLLINGVNGITVTVGEDEAASAVGTPILGPITFAGASWGETITHRFARPIKLTANKSLVVDASGAGAICVLAEGYTA